MKNFTLLFAGMIGTAALIFLNFQLPSQNDPIKDQFAEAPFETKATNGWFVKKNDHQLSVTQLIQNHKSQLGFSKYDKLELKKSETDKLGITHHRYDQYHRGVRIEGGEFFVKEKDGEVTNFNGMWVSDMDRLASPSYSPNQIVQRAMQILPAKKYAWEIPGLEQEYKEDQNDISATRYPQPELVWVDPSFSQNKDKLQLAYKVRMVALDPMVSEILFIDAQNGNLITYETLMTDANTLGTAITRYYGTQNIVTDSIGPNNFRLIENDRPSAIGPNVDIITFNLLKKETFDYGDAVQFTDTDNFWNNINQDYDEYATDLHLGSGLAFDYVTQNLDWNGINNGGVPYRGYAHLEENVENAFFNGGLDRAFFGDGDPMTNSNPLTSIDIVAHEYGHGIVNYTANLRYQRESGALNESYADLFGIATEFMAFPNSNWLLGELIYTDGSFLRSLSNPKDAFDPDTYDGQYWQDPDCDNPNSSDSDNCGVHTNSGVQNKWFYILCEGESGMNDNGDNYNVAPIGMDKAMKIAFRNLRFYLGQDSKYEDALEGSLTAAEDLYGKCSPEYVAVANAWFAVGVGNGLFESDIEVNTLTGFEDENCGLTNAEFPTIDLAYQSCVPALPAGTKLPFAAQVDNGPIIYDSLTLTNELPGFGTGQFTFTKPVSGLETAGMHTLKVWSTFSSDTRQFNDTVSLTMLNIIDQNTDFGGNFASDLTSDCFLTTQNLSANFVFLGCDQIASGTPVDVFYSVNGGTPVQETKVLQNPIFRGGTFSHSFATQLDLTTVLGYSKVDFWVKLNGDFLNDNDSIVGKPVTNPVLMEREDLITFEAGENSLDSFHLQTTNYSNAYPGNFFKFDEPNIVEMTGGDFQNSGAIVPNTNNVWANSNAPLRAQTCMCVDATNMDEIDFSFDLYQSYSRMWQAVFGAENPFGSAARVVVNNTQIGDSFFPVTLNSDDVINRVFNLDAYANTVFEVCIESRCGFSPEFDNFNRGDLVRVDNILLLGRTVGTNDLEEIRGLNISPNPTSGIVNITYPYGLEALQLEVFDISGKRLQSFDQNVLDKNVVDLSTYQSGTYYLKFTNDTQRSIQKVVLVK